MRRLLNRLLLIMLLNFSYSSVALSQTQLMPSCSTDEKLQEARSKELTHLLALDQKEREHLDRHRTIKEIKNGINNDLVRRKRVGEIMAEGCLKTAADYVAASLIYQHGEVPDHYYLAFVWANRAIALGDVRHKGLAAMTIDRYLISIGNKQLFGTQFYAENATHDGCYCLQPVERSFPDTLRMDYLGKKLSHQKNYVSELNNQKINCSLIECPTKLSSTPKGTITGFW